MTDDIWSRDEIDSPCVKTCVIHKAAGICVGCFRTGEEIAQWSMMTPARRREIMAALPERESLLRTRPRRGEARAARLARRNGTPGRTS